MLAALAALITAALAQDDRQSVDIEVVQPAPTCEALGGVERPVP